MNCIHDSDKNISRARDLRLRIIVSINIHATAILVLLILVVPRLVIGDEAGDLKQKGIDALKDSQTNPDVIVNAASEPSRLSLRVE